jgi:hypothetical protein
MGVGRFVAGLRRTAGFRGAAQLFPWLLEASDSDDRRRIMPQLSPPLRVVYLLELSARSCPKGAGDRIGVPRPAQDPKREPFHTRDEASLTWA